jgi:hypothetical protein
MKRVMDTEIELLTTTKDASEYYNMHFKSFPEFYKDSIMAGAKRAGNIYSRRENYLAALDKKKHTIVVPKKVITKEIVASGKCSSLPDEGEMLVKILNELRIHTKQYDELLQIAHAPKQHFTPITTTQPYIGRGDAPTKSFSLPDVGGKSANK